MKSIPHGIVESLEERRLLSGIFLTGTTLLIRGDAQSTNVVDVHYATTGDISVTLDSTNALGLVKHFDKTLPPTSVAKVLIRGGVKNDTINVGRSGSAFNITTFIFAQGGNDLINTGSEADFIDAGAGNDTVSSGNGNDTVRGSTGDDLITVGNGDDKVDGGVGNDFVTAGKGNDLILGGTGNDTITAGNGNDLIYAGPDNDSVLAGDGIDTLWGGRGNDTLTAGNGGDTFGGIVGTNVLTGGTGHNTFYEHQPNTNTTNFDPAKDTIITKGGHDSTQPGTVKAA